MALAKQDDPTYELLAAVAEERQRSILEGGDDRLAKIGRVGQHIRDLEKDVETLEEVIKQKKAEALELKTKTLPDMLREVGMASFTLMDGTLIELKDEVYTDIPAAKREDAFRWLRENGHGDLIKHEIKLSFGMGEDTEARAIRDLLVNHESPLNFTEKETVLPQSLRAWVKDQDRRGAEIPAEVISVHRVTNAHFKTPKGR